MVNRNHTGRLMMNGVQCTYNNRAAGTGDSFLRIFLVVQDCGYQCGEMVVFNRFFFKTLTCGVC